MGRLILLEAKNMQPSGTMSRMLRHKGDVSEGTKYKIIAKRIIMNRKVTFYHNGLREVEGLGLDEQEEHDSEILRLAHASILVKQPVGDKKMCYVDATKNPVEVWVYGMLAEKFIKESTRVVGTGQLEKDFLLNEPIQTTLEVKDHERDVRLFGR